MNKSSSERAKAIRGVSWNLVERLGIQVIRFILGIILARLLSPQEFGIMGIITVFFFIAQTFINSGFGQAYIQKKNVSKEDANTVFYTNLTVSIIFYVGLWFLAPVFAKFYNEPLLIDLFRVMGLIMIVNAVGVIQVAQLTKAVNFKNKSLITLLSVSVGGFAGVFAALKGLSVWSLVIQYMTEKALITLGLWLSSKWRPSFIFSKASFKEMFSYGSWILFSGLITQLFENIYVLVIGKMFPMTELGYYSQAKKFQRISTQQITGAIGDVTFPVFSQAQDNLPKLQNRIKKFIQQTLIFILPMMAAFAVVSESFVNIFLTDKWVPMIPYLRLLCVVGMFYPMNVVNVKVLLALGKSRLNFVLTLVKNSLRIVNIIITSQYGVIYILIGEIIISIISILINIYFVKQVTQYGYGKQFRDVYKFYVSVILSVAAALPVLLFVSNMYAQFILGVLVVFGVYLLLQYLINKPVFTETMKLKDSILDGAKFRLKKKQ